MKPAHRHEPAGIDRRRIVGLGIVAAASLIGILLVALLLWWAWLRPPLHAAEQRIPPMPRLQAHPRTDLQAERAQQHQRLNSYGWVDQAAGIAHVPIVRAMSLLVEQARAEPKSKTKAKAHPEGAAKLRSLSESSAGRSP